MYPRDRGKQQSSFSWQNRKERKVMNAEKTTKGDNYESKD